MKSLHPVSLPAWLDGLNVKIILISEFRNSEIRITSRFPGFHWCLNRHLCDLREGFGKKTSKFGHCVPQSVLRNLFCEVFRKMCSMKYVPQSVL